MRHAPTPAEVAPGLTLAATYKREVHAGIERIWENVLDWEHLPALHEIVSPPDRGVRFAMDSPVEGGVRSEPVSENRSIPDDSGR
jgi:hypothetical protein